MAVRHIEYRVHPAAEVWPQLPDDELKALAESIADVGLLEPIVLWTDNDGTEWLLDGRNRWAACGIADVEPKFTHYAGDPVAYVLARNEHRRHMSKGQRAMATWLTATTTDGALTINTSHLAETTDVNRGMLVWARTVAEHTPDVVPAVLSGAQALKIAYDDAVKARDRAASLDQRLAKLPSDLAALVTDELMALDEAEAAAAERDHRRSEERRDARNLLIRICDLVAPEQPTLDFTEHWAEHLGEVEDELVARVDQTIDVLTDLTKRVRT